MRHGGDPRRGRGARGSIARHRLARTERRISGGRRHPDPGGAGDRIARLHRQRPCSRPRGGHLRPRRSPRPRRGGQLLRDPGRLVAARPGSLRPRSRPQTRRRLQHGGRAGDRTGLPGPPGRTARRRDRPHRRRRRGAGTHLGPHCPHRADGRERSTGRPVRKTAPAPPRPPARRHRPVRRPRRCLPSRATPAGARAPPHRLHRGPPGAEHHPGATVRAPGRPAAARPRRGRLLCRSHRARWIRARRRLRRHPGTAAPRSALHRGGRGERHGGHGGCRRPARRGHTDPRGRVRRRFRRPALLRGHRSRPHDRPGAPARGGDARRPPGHRPQTAAAGGITTLPTELMVRGSTAPPPDERSSP